VASSAVTSVIAHCSTNVSGHVFSTFTMPLNFSIPGIGRYFVSSVSARDYSVVMGITVLTSIIIILMNLMVDIAYGFLDPRTRATKCRASARASGVLANVGEAFLTRAGERR